MDCRKLEDIELLHQLLSDNKQISDAAFRCIYQRYASRVHSYCFKIIKDKQVAEDIFQDTFIKFYQNVRIEKMKVSLLSFLLRIARNLSLNAIRDEKAKHTNYAVDFSSYSIIEEFANTNLQIIQKAIESLELKYREPLVLRLYDGLEYDEIAEVLDITTENARKRVFRAKQQIKVILKPYYDEFIN